MTGKSAMLGRQTWRVYLAVGFLLSVVYFMVPVGIAHHVVFDVIGWSSIIAILYGIRRNRPSNPLPWYLFALGEFGFVAGDMIRAYYESALGVPAPFPGIADIGYTLGYPALVVGLFLFMRSRRAKNRAQT